MPKPRDYAITGRKEVPHGKGTRWCKRCGAFDGLIQKYDILLCRQCFRDIASGLGFAKYD